MTAQEQIVENLKLFRHAQSVGIQSMKGMAMILRKHNPKRMTTADVAQTFTSTAAFLEKLCEVEEGAIGNYDQIITALTTTEPTEKGA